MAFLNLFINKLTYALSDITTNGYLTMIEWDEEKYKDKLEEMKKNLSKLGIKDSSTRIYNTLKELIMNDRKFY